MGPIGRASATLVGRGLCLVRLHTAWAAGGAAGCCIPCTQPSWPVSTASRNNCSLEKLEVRHFTGFPLRTLRPWILRFCLGHGLSRFWMHYLCQWHSYPHAKAHVHQNWMRGPPSYGRAEQRLTLSVPHVIAHLWGCGFCCCLRPVGLCPRGRPWAQPLHCCLSPGLGWAMLSAFPALGTVSATQEASQVFLQGFILLVWGPFLSPSNLTFWILNMKLRCAVLRSLLSFTCRVWSGF